LVIEPARPETKNCCNIYRSGSGNLADRATGAELLWDESFTDPDLGLVILFAALYDLQSGRLSAFFSDFLSLEGPNELGRFRWLPVILAALLLFLSLPVVFEHGLVNEAQRWGMQQGGQFLRVVLPAAVGGLAVIAVAVGTILAGIKK
jgi:hypothetical protein